MADTEETTVTPKLTAVEILEQAKGVIAERGWGTKRYVHPVTGCVCAEGAVRVVSGDWEGDDTNDDALFEALETLDTVAADRGEGNIVAFNDRQESPEPVVELFDEAIERLRRAETRNVLKQAKRFLESRGRARIVLVDGEGCVCPLGAIGLAIGLTPEEMVLGTKGQEDVYEKISTHPAARTLASVIDPIAKNDDPAVIWGFNDYRRTTTDEVLEKFDEAIKKVL